MEAPKDSPGVLVFPPVLFGGTLLVGLILHWIRPVAVMRSWVARLVGLLILLASGALVRAAETSMRRAGTDPRPDHPSLAIVTEGPFRFTRNPMYVGTTGLYVAVSLLANALWPLVLLLPMLAILHWGIVRREERYLERRFGEPYRAYRSRVRRWV